MLRQLDILISQEDVSHLEQLGGWNFDENRRKILENTNSSLDIQACPGSGKTTLIAAKLILLAKKWPYKHQGICVLSHTNVAKDEIITRLKESNSLQLLSYPHFIGTIQEFVNRFAALPYLRSQGIENYHIDDEQYTEQALKVLDSSKFSWLKGTLNGLGKKENINSFLQGVYYLPNKEVNINKTPKAWKKEENLTKAKSYLNELKKNIEKKGFFLFRDMYFFANITLEKNLKLAGYLQKRFPIVLIDEMQDTQKYQDELLQKAFPANDSNSIVQRFGDPDQAIFNGINAEESNETYNKKLRDDMVVIKESHRFSHAIAQKIKNLSFNGIDLQSASNDGEQENNQSCIESQLFQHTTILYDDSNIQNVIATFADLVSQQFSNKGKEKSNLKVKVLGAVGNEIDENKDKSLKIGHYFSDFDKRKSQKSFKGESLIEAVYYCRALQTIDYADAYKILQDCILKILRLAEKENFNAAKLKEYLQNKSLWKNYRELIYILLKSETLINEELWIKNKQQLINIFELNDLPESLQNYLKFKEIPFLNVEKQEKADQTKLRHLGNNILEHVDGFKIEICTIHAAKGETHDATLVLETKNHCYDLSEMIPYLAGDCPNPRMPNNKLREKPHTKAQQKANQQFMKQLYVAMSRPHSLLCLAIHKDRLKENDLEKLKENGWEIKCF